MAIIADLLGDLVGRFAVAFAAALHASTVVVGDKLGLYRALARSGRARSEELAAATGYDERLVAEWLNAQFVSGYCCYDARTGQFWLTEEQAALLADEASPAFMVGAMTIAASIAKDEDKVRERFRTGAGLGGTSTTRTSSTAPSGCSSPATSRTWCRRGSRRWTVSSRPSARAAPWPTSAAVTVPRHSCWRRPICTPSAQAQAGGHVLGNQVPATTWRQLLTEAGFSRFRRAAETPFNRVFELRP